MVRDGHASNISFMGIRPIGDGIPNSINQLFESIDFNIDYIGSIRDGHSSWYKDFVCSTKSGRKGENTYQKLINNALCSDKYLINDVSNWYFF